MSLAEIIEELPKLTAEERQAIYRQIEELDGAPLFEATEEMRAAIDEATRSLEAGKGIPLEEVRQRFLATWANKQSWLPKLSGISTKSLLISQRTIRQPPRSSESDSSSGSSFSNP